MAIPWTTALYVVRKILPVVIDKAPELLRTIERRRTAPPQTDESADRSLDLIHQRIHSLEQITAAQTEALTELQARLSATRRSLALVWLVLLAAVLIETATLAVLFFRS